MDLEAVAFPALLIADDGYIEYAPRREDLATWSSYAIAKYNTRRVVLFDSSDSAWTVERIVPTKPMNALARLLAKTVYNPQVPARVEVAPIVEAPLAAVRDVLIAAIDADDDVLTQWAESGDLKDAVGRPKSFKGLVSALKKKGAI